MRYDPFTRELFASDGRYLKTLSCPLNKCWAELKATDRDARQRHCDNCGNPVISLAGLGEESAVELLRSAPHTCVHVQPASVTVVPSFEASAHTSAARKIETARSVEAMNAGVIAGFWPLVERAIPNPRARYIWISVYQDETGKVRLEPGSHLNSWRPPDAGHQCLFSFEHHPDPPSSPIAAYLVPPDIKVGEEVILVDPIEEVAGGNGQGEGIRAMHVRAFWNGRSFAMDYASIEQLEWLG